MKKRVLLFTFIGAIIAVAAAIAFVWNKPHETVEGRKGLAISAEELAVAFGQNEQQANATYLNKVIEVTGKISEVTKNQDNKDVLLLESSDPLSGVQCTMMEPGGWQPGQTATIKGFCSGYTTVVLLSDCQEVK